MRELNIFGRSHKYEYNFEIASDIKVMNELKIKIAEPQTLSYCGMETINIYTDANDRNFICSDCIKWIYNQYKDKIDKDIRECLLKCSIEDVVWTKWRNDGYNSIYYRKITFFPEIQKMVCSQIDEYLKSLNIMYEEWVLEEQKENEEIECQKKEWSIVKIYKDVSPLGGKNGRDGYFDADYRDLDENVVRMVSRDMFDFGCYSYPKRFEKTDDVFNRTVWTNDEKRLEDWLIKFGKFHGVRM